MATITGRVLLNPKSEGAQCTSGCVPQANIQIVLQNLENGFGKVGFTDTNGKCIFTNVPFGDYRIVEAWGTEGALASPVDFTGNIAIAEPKPRDPDINVVEYPGKVESKANKVNSLSKNTYFLKITNDTEYEVRTFIDAPIRDIPYFLSGFIREGKNLIMAADKGTFGEIPNGSYYGISSLDNPYPEIVSLNEPKYGYMKYYLSPPARGNFSVVNQVIDNHFQGKWVNISDHTTGYEAGRMQVVTGIKTKGIYPGYASFFKVTEHLEVNTNYSFTCWVCPLDRSINAIAPKIGLQVRGEDNSLIENSIISDELKSGETLIWYEIGKEFNTNKNSVITISLIDISEAGIGNSFAVDDISLHKIVSTSVEANLVITTEVDKTKVIAAKTLTYTIKIVNNSKFKIINAIFTDYLQKELCLVKNSLIINGKIVHGNYDLRSVFLGAINEGEKIEITFSAIVISMPRNMKVTNNSCVEYSYLQMGVIKEGKSISNIIEAEVVCPKTTRR